MRLRDLFGNSISILQPKQAAKEAAPDARPMPESARDGRQRMADTVVKLRAEGADTWVATASPSGIAHLVPLSYAWNGACIILAAEASSLTVRNIRASGRIRLGFGPTRDVLIVDGELERLMGVDDDAWDETGRAYAGQADWDPRLESGTYVFVLVRPRRVQAWREANELAGRVLMEDGAWLYPSQEEAT